MGKIIRVPFSEILPGEGGFNLESLANNIDFYKKQGEFLAVPVRLYNGKYVNLDGRHSLLCQKIIGRSEALLYHAENYFDKMTNKMFPEVETRILLERNELIARRWCFVAMFADHIGIRDYNEHFENLVKACPFLKDEESYRRFLND